MSLKHLFSKQPINYAPRFFRKKVPCRLRSAPFLGDDSSDVASIDEISSRFVATLPMKISRVHLEWYKKHIDETLRVFAPNVLSSLGQRLIHDIARLTPQQEIQLHVLYEAYGGLIQEDAREIKDLPPFEQVKEMCRFSLQGRELSMMHKRLISRWLYVKHKYEENKFIQEGGSFWPEDEDEDDGEEQYRELSQSNQIIWPEEAKMMSGKCKVITNIIMDLLRNYESLIPLLAVWKELVQPTRVDWIALLDMLKENNHCVYLKVAELVFDEESFQPNMRDCFNLVEALPMDDLKCREEILKKMNEKGILPNIILFPALAHMYVNAGKLDCAKEAFNSAKETYENLRRQVVQRDTKVTNSLVGLW